MKFVETPLIGAYVISHEPIRDHRGWFARSFCRNEFAKYGLCTEFVQNNTSYSKTKGTVRGLHFQRTPHEEVKVVSCINGSIFDVIVDNRPNSPTYLQWFSVELDDKKGDMLYVPKGFAHGYQTLTDDAVVFYLVSAFYHGGFEGGLRWDDELLSIHWPIKKGAVISEKDLSISLLDYKEKPCQGLA